MGKGLKTGLVVLAVTKEIETSTHTDKQRADMKGWGGDVGHPVRGRSRFLFACSYTIITSQRRRRREPSDEGLTLILMDSNSAGPGL